MAVNQKIQNQEPKATKVSSATNGSRTILRVTLAPERGDRAFSLKDAFGVAAANYGAEEDRVTVLAHYIPAYANRGSSEVYKFPPEYWGYMHLAVVGVLPLTADGGMAILSAFITEDANEMASRTQFSAVKVENMSILKAGVFAQLTYDFSTQCGEVIFLATGTAKEQKFSLTRSRMFADWGVTSIPEIPTLNRYFDPVTQQFIPCSHWRTAGEMLPERAEEEPNFTDAAEKKVEEPEVLIGGVEANGEKAAEAAVVIESSTEPLVESGTESVVESSDKPAAKPETTEDRAAVEQDQLATAVSGSGKAPTQEQISRILAMSQASDKDLSPEDQAAVNELLKGMKPEQLGQ